MENTTLTNHDSLSDSINNVNKNTLNPIVKGTLNSKLNVKLHLLKAHSAQLKVHSVHC